MSASKIIKWFVAVVALTSVSVEAQRIKDMAEIAGIRSNHLVGYGLVVGLEGTGEQTEYTSQSFKTMLKRFGISLPDGVEPKSKNIAAVAVSAELPPFAKPGQTIDVTVSSLGSAKSLRGGSLLLTPLKGVDGQIYALAQGNLAVSGFGISAADGSKITVNVPTAGRVPNGATIERAVSNSFGTADHIIFNLKQPDFSTAKNLADVINERLGSKTAKPIDAASIRVNAPRDPGQKVMYLSFIENLEVQHGQAPAKIIVNSRTGTVVIGQHVQVSPAAVSHGSMVVTISENQTVVQPGPFAGGDTAVGQQSNIDVKFPKARMFNFNPGV